MGRIERSMVALSGQPPSMRPKAAMVGGEAHHRSLRRLASSIIAH